MNNQSTKRRMAGRGLVAAALVALPLTATITYADSTSFDEVFADVPAPPAPPTLGSVAPTPPTPPAINRAASTASALNPLSQDLSTRRK
mgnify:CR=1 FL=1